MKTFAKYFVFLFLPILLIILWLAGFFHSKMKAEEVEKEKRVVRGLVIKPVEVVEEIAVPYTATVVPEDQVEISTRVMGYIIGEFVKEGDVVKKGQTLFVIDPTEAQAQVDIAKQRIEQAQKNYLAAKAHYDSVKKTYERYRELLKEGAITKQEYDQVEAQYRAAEAQLEAAKAEIGVATGAYRAAASQLSYYQIKAPFDGYVVQKLADKGDIAVPGKPLAILEKGPYKVESYLPEKYFDKVKVGDTVTVYIGLLGRSFPARIVEKEAAVNPQTRTFKVKAVIQEEGVKLRGGLFAELYITEKLPEKTVLVPASAIYKRWDFTGVWVVKPDGTLELRFVRLGRELNGYYEVLSGLSPGDKIVIEGLEKACDGCKVGG